MDSPIRRYNHRAGILMLVVADIAGGEPDRDCCSAGHDHGGMNGDLPVVRPGRVVLRMKNELGSLSNAFPGCFGEAEAFETDDDTHLDATKVECLNRGSGRISNCVERRKSCLVM